MTRSCARRNLAAETIFMALVICCVFLTDRMRRRMSIRLGMRALGSAGAALPYEAALELLDRGLHLAAQGIVERLLLPDLLPDVRVCIVDKPVQLLFEPAALF